MFIAIAAAALVLVAPVLPVDDGTVTSSYGYRDSGFHDGRDVAAPVGTPVHSVSGGVVIKAGSASGYGLWVRVRNDDGTVATYGHVHEILVSEGERVEAGEVIATVGARGDATGPHLHFEISSGVSIIADIDPSDYLAGATPTGTGSAETATTGSYTVQRGDTLSGIAVEHGMRSWVPLYRVNTDVVENPDLIYPGEVLTIPKGA